MWDRYYQSNSLEADGFDDAKDLDSASCTVCFNGNYTIYTVSVMGCRKNDVREVHIGISKRNPKDSYDEMIGLRKARYRALTSWIKGD